LIAIAPAIGDSFLHFALPPSESPGGDAHGGYFPLMGSKGISISGRISCESAVKL
jgi:hypothetical protein